VLENLPLGKLESNLLASFLKPNRSASSRMLSDKVKPSNNRSLTTMSLGDFTASFPPEGQMTLKSGGGDADFWTAMAEELWRAVMTTIS
jgi:hypothetical protein